MAESYSRSFTIDLYSNNGSDDATELVTDKDYSFYSNGDASLEIAGFSAPRAFKGKNDYGWLLGTYSATGSVKFTLNKAVKITSIVYRAAQYNGDEKGIVVNDSVNNKLNADLASYTINMKNAVETNEVKIETTDKTAKHAYIKSIEVFYESEEVVKANAYVNIPNGSDISKYLKQYLAKFADDGKILKNLTIELNYYGEYTISEPIEPVADINIYGNGATIDASELEGPFIQMSKTPMADKLKTYDANEPDQTKWKENNYYGISVYLSRLNIKGLKNSIFYDNKVTYCATSFDIYNSNIELNTEAVKYEALISFEGGGAKDFKVRNSTIYGNGKVAKYFLRYSNAARLDRYGFDTENDFQTMTYTNNTFYNLLKSDGQWGNYSQIGGRLYSKFNVQKNIWYNCGKDIIKRLVGGRFHNDVPEGQNTFAYNTYFNEGKDISAGEKDYDKSETILTTDPGFKDAENADFTLTVETMQNAYGTGDSEWITAPTGKYFRVYTYDPTDEDTEIFNKGTVTWSTTYCRENQIVQFTIDPYTNRKYWDNDKNQWVDGPSHEVKSVEVFVEGSWDDAKGPRRALDLLKTVDVKKLNDNTYYFFMPRSNVRVKITYKEIIENVDDHFYVVGIEDQKVSEKEWPENGVELPNLKVRDYLKGWQPQFDENGDPILDDNDNQVWDYNSLEKDKDYTVEYENNTEAGEATVIVKGIGNYTGEVRETFNIIKEIEAETEDEGDLLVEIISEEEKTCVITKITAKEDEPTLTIPAQVRDYDVVFIADNALKGATKDLTIYLPALGEDKEGFIEIAENALLPKGFTHPSEMFNVFVEDVKVLDDYAKQPGLEKLAKYSHLMAEVTIPESGYATFSTGIPVVFDNTLEVNIVKAFSAEAVKKEAVKDNKVDAGVGVLLYGKAGKHAVYALDENIEIDAVDGNLLVGVPDATNYPIDEDDAAANSYFILKEGAFFAIADNDNEVPSCKAILQVAKGDAAAAASRLDIVIDGFTGINAVKADLNNAQIYDMQGRKVNNAQKGVYIVNGKKVVIK